ncbi:MAG: ABC transporter ATP-binding protein [Alphaproteobacteria bacterium]
MIAVDNLTVRFGPVEAVGDVTFTVRAGESFGLVGESGSGKSTVLRAIAGLAATAEGRVLFDGAAVRAPRGKGFHKAVQMVFQDPYGSLHPRHTVDRILSEPAVIHGLPEVDRRVEAILAGVGLGPQFRFRFPHQLSGGQRQRVAIGRALMPEPTVLLLDEPTSSLDVSVQAEVLNLLQRIKAERGLTFILVSHNLAVVAHMCDRMAVMNRGRIVEQVTRAGLRQGRAAEPYTRQLLAASKGFDREFARELIDYA